MKYNVDTLKELYNRGEHFKYLFFWGHTPKKDETIGPFCLSQWYPSPFVVNNITYTTAEHWMMTEKARLFNDSEIEAQIINSTVPGQVKELGRKIKGFDEEVWMNSRFDIVVAGNLHKFLQNEALKEYLLNTHERLLVEASPVDNIWGIGLSKESKDIENPNTWRGTNLLGFALMEVRDNISLLEDVLNLNKEQDTVILYRPVGPKELALIKSSGWKAFPPRLPEQPIFYPVLNEEYAVQIARDWNVPASGSGFVTKFEIEKKYMLQFEIQNVGGHVHNELWVPAEELEEFNRHIRGKIEVIAEFHQDKASPPAPLTSEAV